MNWLNNLLRDRGWSQTELARRAQGVSRSLVNLVLSGKQPPSFDFVAAIARAVGERPEPLFRMVGLVPPYRGGEEAAGDQELLEILSALPPEDKRHLRQYVEFLLTLRRGEEGGRT